MRSFIVLFGMCGLISAALAQSPEVEWVLQLGFENDEIISDVVSLSDGGFAAIGVEQYYPPEFSDTTHGWWLLRISPVGDTLWTRFYEIDSYPTAIFKTADGGFAVAGQYFELLRLSANGDSLWYSIDDDWNYFGGIGEVVMSPSGTYLMGGNCEFSCWTPETQYQAKILEMDAEGNILWRRLYGGPQDDYFTSICALSFGGIVGIGYLYGGWSSVLHVGANGDSVNTFMVPEPVDPAYVREINQGDYVFGGRVYVDGLYRVGLLNMHEDGNLVWERQYGTEVHHLPWTFDTTSDGGYVITGRTGDYPGDSVFVLRTTASGDSLWYTTLGDVDSFYVLAAHQTPDGGYIFCGGSGEWPRDFKLVKLTPELGVAAPPSSPASFTLLQNYPNPFNAATEIRYELTSASHVTLRVSDLLGREVAVLVNQNMSPGSYAVSFDAADLPSGIYLYSLAAGLHHATRKMILLR